MGDDLLYWLGFSAFPGIGPVRFRLLREYFGQVKDAWNAKEDVLRSLHVSGSLVSSFVDFRRTFDLHAYYERLVKNHVGIVTIDHPKYPRLLKEIPDAPFLLYVKGRKTQEGIDMENTVAVVGARKKTAYGEEVTKEIVRTLVSYGVTIVSGMAYGIDAIAHETAIAEGGKTIAVLGCGIDICAPMGNIHIYRKVTDGGCGAVVSEMPLGMRPDKGLFPARNRIISGLSLGVVIIEGTSHSGTLITARNAAEQGREVFAIPGPITSATSHGPSILLRSGAVLIESADDIISSLGLAKDGINRNNRKGIIH